MVSSLCAIALGSNLGSPVGNSQTTLTAALQVLNNTPGMQVITRSHWYRTKAVGPPQPDYLNGCALLRTDLTPLDLMSTLLQVESQFGRIRRERWGARTLDLDLLLFNDQMLLSPRLEIPHPRMAERAFVLVPLAEIAPDWQDPRSGQSIQQLLHQVDCSEVVRLEVMQLEDEHLPFTSPP
ncbi:MAG: 2-amino-4-hydroxy-6-hydroxymethyldihydropteridine diphosphokinase [Synechococcales bacterium]|nr:2-amino-4-hydroxy-6-hydroxymethyldihydropteridine diphosphokinase [Synechococcales bacterium]